MKALITGATSGIGREMAKILAVRGVDLIIASRDEKKMKSLAKRLPVAVRTIAVDLSKAEDCYRLYDAVKAGNGAEYAGFERARGADSDKVVSGRFP